MKLWKRRTPNNNDTAQDMTGSPTHAQGASAVVRGSSGAPGNPVVRVPEVPKGKKTREASNEGGGGSQDPDGFTTTSLHVFMRSRKKVLFDGDVFSFTSKNAKGEFDILPMHANFITMISDEVILDKGKPSEQKFDIKTAVLSVENNKVDVYVDVA